MTPSTLSPPPSTPFLHRLLPMPDGRPGLRGGMHVTVQPPATPPAPPSPGSPRPSDGRGVRGEGQGSGEGRGEGGSSPASPIRDNPCNSCLDFISSDDTLDRYNEIISPAGWKLDNYIRNPVFQNSHQYGDIIFTLGKATITEARTVAGRQALFQRIEFAVQANPMARIAHALYRDGFLNTVSVGFIPVRWEDGNSTTPYARKFLEQELLEVSAVSIPANPNALALGLKSGSVEKSDLRELSDLLRHALSAPPSAIDYRPLYHLACQLRELLRHT